MQRAVFFTEMCIFQVSTYLIHSGRSHCRLFHSRSPLNHVQVLHLDLKPEEFQLCRSVALADHGHVLCLHGPAYEDEHARPVQVSILLNKQTGFFITVFLVLNNWTDSGSRDTLRWPDNEILEQ